MIEESARKAMLIESVSNPSTLISMVLRSSSKARFRKQVLVGITGLGTRVSSLLSVATPVGRVNRSLSLV